MRDQYLLRRAEDGKFVSRPGSKSSYTKRLECARVFTRDQAMAERCGNETLIRLDSIIPELQ